MYCRLARTEPPALICVTTMAVMVTHNPDLAAHYTQRAVHLHGSLGTTRELPLAEWWSRTPHMALVDGPTEVHTRTVAKGALRNVEPASPFRQTRASSPGSTRWGHHSPSSYSLCRGRTSPGVAVR